MPVAAGPPSFGRVSPAATTIVGRGGAIDRRAEPQLRHPGGGLLRRRRVEDGARRHSLLAAFNRRRRRIRRRQVGRSGMSSATLRPAQTPRAPSSPLSPTRSACRVGRARSSWELRPSAAASPVRGGTRSSRRSTRAWTSPTACTSSSATTPSSPRRPDDPGPGSTTSGDRPNAWKWPRAASICRASG